MANLTPTTSRWLWVNRWLLIIPQVVLLALPAGGLSFAWICAFVAIVFTVSYPRPLSTSTCAFCVGLASQLLLLGDFRDRLVPAVLPRSRADFPAHLEVVYPQDRNRWLVLVKGFLAIPHLIHRGDPWGELGRCGTARRLDVSLLRGLIRILAVGFRGDPRLLWHLSPGLVRPADGSEPVGVPGAGVQGGDDWAIPPFGLDSGGDDPGTALNTSVAPQDQP